MNRRRAVWASALLGAAIVMQAAGARAAPPEPEVGTFTDADVLRVIEEDLARPFVPAQDCGRYGEQGDGGRSRGPSLLLNSDDNDTAHYKRGMTLVIHVFINHTGGTWSTTERDAAGAKASQAKTFYLNRAPGAANARFDNQGTNNYHYYTATLGYNVPADGLTLAMMEDAVANIGFADGDGDGSRFDDMSLWLQNWGGGWDNVLLCFEPADITGRAWASYGWAVTRLYTDDTHSVWRHEWGHLFGACDEYVEASQCNGGIDCGACQSAYLLSTVNNGNCALAACPSNVSCVMRNNVDAICDYTLRHWAWVDGDNDGLLDRVKRRTTGSNFVNIWELYHNGWFYWNGVGDGMVVSQRWSSWAVIGLRSPATADYDLRVYGDNNHNYLYASSSYGGSAVDFVVGDYNHSTLGNEHIEVRRFSGAADNYNLTWEGGSETLYPDGVVRSGNWADFNVVRVWDVPLFGGETVSFVLSVTGGSPNLGMALFRSNGAPYYAGRSAAVASADAGGAGATESFTYTVPTDDVYGLVVWANGAVAGTFTIQIGPAPVALSEEVWFNSSLDLRLYSYDPIANYWAFAGVRPQPGTDVRLSLFDDAAYQTLLATSDYPAGQMDFVAVDYNHASSAVDYLRVARTSGAGTHRTEWEQSPDIISGAVPTSAWTVNHLGKIWDASLQAGVPYFVREYHASGSTFDTGLYLFSSSDGDYFKERAAFAAASNFRPPGDGGEWLSYTPGAADWYGVLLIANDETSDAYSLWLGRKEVMAEDTRYTRGEEIIWGSNTVSSIYWTVFGVRPLGSDVASVWLYGDDAYTLNTLAASDQVSPGVRYVVGDYNHNPLGVVYPRFRRESGFGQIDFSWEGGAERFVYTPGSMNVYDLTWPAGDVVKAWDVYVDGSVVGGRNVAVQVEDLSGGLDLGVEFFRSNGAAYYARRGQGVAASDATGEGGAETVVYRATTADWYGIVIFSKNARGGNYRVRVWDPAAVSVAGPVVPPALRLASAPNPFIGSASLTVALPGDGRVRLAVFDLQGRQVRGLVDGSMRAGEHRVTWDGRDDGGAPLPAGVYLVSLRTDAGQRQVKLVRGR